MKIDLDNMNQVTKGFVRGLVADNNDKHERQKPIYTNLKNYLVLDVYEIGEYQVAKAKTKSGEINYVAFVNYEPTGRFEYTVEEALFQCMAYKHDGENSQFTTYAAKMINIVSEPEFEK